MKILGGIDAGGTRTRFALVQEDGSVIGYAEGGCSSFVELGIDDAGKVLNAIWQSAWASAGRPPCHLDGLFIGSGSILHSDDVNTNRGLAVAAGFTNTDCVWAENDAWNALAGGLSGRPGILLIAGTGSACLGRNAEGQTWRAGGWGHLLDDVGSAYYLGQAAMVAATRAADGRGPVTSLTTLVCEKLGLQDLKQIYHKLHHDGVPRSDVAALAPFVIRLAEAGDAVSLALVNAGTQGLAEMVTTVARQLRLASPELALTGGLVTNAVMFRAEFLKRMETELPDFKLADHGVIPVLGAVLLAFEAVTKSPANDLFLEKLRQTATHFTGLRDSQ